MENKKITNPINFDSSQKIKKPIKLKTTLIIFGVILVALLIFSLGVVTGLHKGRFSCNWGKNYERNFMGHGIKMNRSGFLSKPPKEFMDRFEGRGFRNAHGLVGSIISITENNKIIVKDKDNKENTVAINDKTIIKFRRDDLKITDLKQNDEIVVIGKPDERVKKEIKHMVEKYSKIIKAINIS